MFLVHLHLLCRAEPDVAEALAHGLEQRVAEGVDEDGIDAADAVGLDKVTLHARHHGPDVDKGKDGKEDSPDQCQGNADQRRQQPVAPVLGDGEGGEASFPHAVKAVCSRRLCNDVLEVHLKTRRAE